MNWRGALCALTFAVGGCGWPDGAVVVEQTADDRSPSVARSWNEVVLAAIRNDFARPTVHARNLFHISAAMYDAWSVYSDTAETYLLGKQLGAFSCNLGNFTAPGDLFPAREEAIAYAAYRLILHRFAASPGAVERALTTRSTLTRVRHRATRAHQRMTTSGVFRWIQSGRLISTPAMAS